MAQVLAAANLVTLAQIGSPPRSRRDLRLRSAALRLVVPMIPGALRLWIGAAIRTRGHVHSHVVALDPTLGEPDGSVEITDDRQLETGLPVALERFDDTGVRVRVVPNAS